MYRIVYRFIVFLFCVSMNLTLWICISSDCIRTNFIMTRTFSQFYTPVKLSYITPLHASYHCSLSLTNPVMLITIMLLVFWMEWIRSGKDSCFFTFWLATNCINPEHRVFRHCDFWISGFRLWNLI